MEGPLDKARGPGGSDLGVWGTKRRRPVLCSWHHTGRRPCLGVLEGSHPGWGLLWARSRRGPRHVLGGCGRPLSSCPAQGSTVSRPEATPWAWGQNNRLQRQAWPVPAGLDVTWNLARRQSLRLSTEASHLSHSIAWQVWGCGRGHFRVALEAAGLGLGREHSCLRGAGGGQQGQGGGGDVGLGDSTGHADMGCGPAGRSSPAQQLGAVTAPDPSHSGGPGRGASASPASALSKTLSLSEF